MSMTSWALQLFEIPHMCCWDRSHTSYSIGQYILDTAFHVSANMGHVGKLVHNLGPQYIFFAKFEKYCKIGRAHV